MQGSALFRYVSGARVRWERLDPVPANDFQAPNHGSFDANLIEGWMNDYQSFPDFRLRNTLESRTGQRAALPALESRRQVPRVLMNPSNRFIQMLAMTRSRP